MTATKEEKYLQISKEIADYVGGENNILGVAHCATRLRIVVEDQAKVDMKKIETVALVKGAFVTGDQIQIIFGAGLVNEVYEVFAKYTHKENMTLQDVKSQATQKQNPIQRVIKSLSDVFIEIMPAILAAALLMGLSGLLGQQGLFGKKSIVEMVPMLAGLNRFISIVSSSVFSILPLIVVWSSTKRYGGRAILGLVIGALMLSNNLADAYQAAQGAVKVETISLLGLKIQLVGFQGGIIIALMMGFVVVGPVGRLLASGLTTGLVWMTQNLGFVGYAIFGGVQQIIVITGLHHLFGAIEGQLLVDTGRDFINPIASVAVCAQGGAVLGYLIPKWKDVKSRELCIPAFTSTLFGISEPAIFGVNLRNKYPFVAGCLASAVASVFVYFSGLTALGYGTTVLPGFAIVAPENNGYINYLIAHLIALVGGMLITLFIGKVVTKKNTEVNSTTVESKEETNNENKIESGIKAYATGELISIEDVKDPTFSKKIMGEGFAIIPTEGKVCAPCDAKVETIFFTKHAIGLKAVDGTEMLIHIGIDTVNLNGKYFKSYVKEGDYVKAGDTLITFEMDKVKNEGYDTVIPLVFTNPEKKFDIKNTKRRSVSLGEEL